MLALVGGIALVLGIALFVALASDRGWIGEGARIALAFAGSVVLLVAGVWLHEARGRTQASLAAVGTALAGLFVTVTAAAVLYELVPASFAPFLAGASGAAGTALAVRWSSRTIAGIGILGALLAPVLVQAPETAAMAFLAAALAAAVGVLVWRRWDWLAVAAFAVVWPQIAAWTLAGPPGSGPSGFAIVSVLAVVAALNLAAALGYEVRVPTAKLRPSSALLVAASALLAAVLGYFALPHGDGDLSGGLWIVALAGAYGALGAAAFRWRRVGRDVALVVVGATVVLADTAFGLLVDGWALAVGWAASSLLAAWLLRHARDRQLVQVALGAQLSLACAHALLFDAPPTVLATEPRHELGAVSALAAIAVAAFGVARLSLDDGRVWPRVLDALSLATLAYVTAVTLSGAALAIAWALQAAALAHVAHMTRDRIARGGALGLLALAGAHALVLDAPPDALVYGVESLLAAAAALAAVAVSAARAARVGPPIYLHERTVLQVLAVAALVYLASVAIVTAFQPGLEAGSDGFGLSVRQQGQALLSAFWGACGLAALWVGLRRRGRILRLGGFGLLSLAIAKVFLYDLSALDSVYRVASLVALGLVLLLAAFSYQRNRPVERAG